MAPPSTEMHAFALPDLPVRSPAALPEVATLAMQRFTCIGAACEDTCCQDFGISIDRPGLRRMLAATALDPIQHERIVRLVVLGAPPPGGGVATNHVHLSSSGACPLLETSGQCGVQERYGEAALSTTCSVFPRTSLAVEDRLEITGTLACPEMARLTLLAPDGLLQRPSPRPLLSQSYVGKVIDTGIWDDDAYAAPFTRVRETLLRLFGCVDFPLGSRLAFAAQLADQLDDFFRRGTTAFAGSRRLFARQRLDAELAAAATDTTMESLHRDLQAFEGGGETVAAAAASLLTERRSLPHSARYAALIGQTFTSLQIEAFGRAQADQAITSAQLFAVMTSRRDLMERRLPGLFDQILARYCRHFLLRQPYTDAPSLLAYLGRLALSLAAIRLLLLGAPAVRSLLDETADPDADVVTLSRTAVDVIQIFTKAVSHHSGFLAAVHQAAEDSGVTFGRLVLFAKFI